MFMLARLGPVRRALRGSYVAPSGHAALVESPNVAVDGAGLGEIIGELSRSGLVSGLSLAPDLSDAIRRFAATTPCFANFDWGYEFLAADHTEAQQRLGRPILTGHFFDRVDRCSAIAGIQQDGLLHQFAVAYLGPRARVISTRLWWSFPTEAVSDAALNQASQDRLHFDLDDWLTLKFFFYLTDVDADSGPFAYLKGSHRNHERRHQWTLVCGHPNNDVLSAYGEANLHVALGAAGTGIMVDPFGFHMGLRPKHTTRLMLEIGFGVSTALRRRFYGAPPRPTI